MFFDSPFNIEYPIIILQLAFQNIKTWRGYESQIICLAVG